MNGARRARVTLEDLEIWTRDYYGRHAFTVVVNFLAVILGFSIATAWEARKDQLDDTIELVSVLDPLRAEITRLIAHTKQLQSREQCAVEGYEIPYWEEISASKDVRVLRDLYGRVRQVYVDLAAAASQPDCRAALTDMRRKLELLEDDLERSLQYAEARLGQLTRDVQTGRPQFILGLSVVTVGALLALPAALYHLLAGVSRGAAALRSLAAARLSRDPDDDG